MAAQTIPQPYIYPYSAISGSPSVFDNSDHLFALIVANIPTWSTNPNIDTDDTAKTVTISGDRDLTTDEKAVLDSLVDRANDNFIITSDGGRTDLGEPAAVSNPAGPQSAVTITLQYKKGDTTNRTGVSDGVAIKAPLMTLDATSGKFDPNTGQFSFTLGAQLVSRGTATVVISSDSLPAKTLNATWT